MKTIYLIRLGLYDDVIVKAVGSKAKAEKICYNYDKKLYNDYVKHFNEFSYKEIIDNFNEKDYNVYFTMDENKEFKLDKPLSFNDWRNRCCQDWLYHYQSIKYEG